MLHLIEKNFFRGVGYQQDIENGLLIVMAKVNQSSRQE